MGGRERERERKRERERERERSTQSPRRSLKSALPSLSPSFSVSPPSGCAAVTVSAPVCAWDAGSDICQLLIPNCNHMRKL